MNQIEAAKESLKEMHLTVDELFELTQWIALEIAFQSVAELVSGLSFNNVDALKLFVLKVMPEIISLLQVLDWDGILEIANQSSDQSRLDAYEDN